MVDAYRVQLEKILACETSAETIVSKMQLIHRLDDLYMEIFNEINLLLMKNPEDPSVIILQEFEIEVADAKAQLSRRLFGQIL